MLTLDIPSAAVHRRLESYGIKEDDISIALRLDMNKNGGAGRTWIFTCAPSKKICILSTEKSVYGEDKEEDYTLYSEHLMSEVSGFYVDNFISGNRWLYKTPEKTTEIMAYCSNSCKKRLFTFIEITERLMNEKEVTDDDPIFDQYRAKCPKCHKPYADQNNKICANCIKKSATLKRMLSYLKNYKWHLAVSLIGLFLSAGMGLVSPYLTGTILYDRIIAEEGDLHYRYWIFIVVGLVVLLNVVSSLNNILRSRVTTTMGVGMVMEMKSDVFRAMQSLSLSFYNNNQTGKLIKHVNGDAETVRNFCIGDVPTLLYHSVTIIGLSIFLFILNWKLTLIIYLPIPLIVLILKKGSKKLWKSYEKYWRAASSLNSGMADSLNGRRVVKSFAKEVDETNKFTQLNRKDLSAWVNINNVSLTIFPLIGLLIAFSSKAIWGVGGIMVMNNQMTYGYFSAYFSYVAMILGPIGYLTNFMQTVTNATNSAQRMFQIIDTESEVREAPNPVNLDDTMQGSFEMRNVSFSYVPNRPILKDVNIKISPGDHIGLVGHTGSGKTTIANLISRLYDPNSGEIFLDGIDIKNIKTSSLRKNIAMVSQEVFLFNGSIYENIAYAKPKASYDEVIRAARLANAHDFIMRLPSQYETNISMVPLSGGERQRISIARALLLDPKILILDEATAAMDTETERLIQDALDILTEGRTTITIAHRLSTLKNCNYLYVIEDGMIAEEGTHAELIKKKGTYYKLYTLQNEAMKRVMLGI
ncbi:MAG: ABC transporter ATP-binding protein [Ruminococcaceae bacterium]|nr:ABC transporter ATP-binding protein [Oscillospiraceae bacterium]